MNIRSSQSDSAVTLVELLVVLCIICTLASLSLGAIHVAHARAMAALWRIEAPRFITLIHERLSEYYQSKTNYPAWTADDLHRRGVFDNRTMQFLRSPNVSFIPFSSTDPDDKWVLRVVNIWPLEKHATGLIKESITKFGDRHY
jgi:competence protein ComGC